MKFSQRLGFTPTEKAFQIESIDEELKNGLWNVYKVCVLNRIDKKEFNDSNLVALFTHSLWHNLFKERVDLIPSSFFRVEEQIRLYFFSAQWYDIYDFIEFTVDMLEKVSSLNFINLETLQDQFNIVLEREFSGYRFINKQLSPVTNSTEIKEIEDVLSVTDNFTLLKECNTHLQSSLSKFSDRQNPDYSNSIKESISAVEAIVKILNGSTKGTLAAALDKIKGKLKIHSSLEVGFKALYGYTSDADGIRHSLKPGESMADFEDAKYMLVSCSAFINYLIAKANKAGIALQ